MALADGPASLDNDMMLWRAGISLDRDHLLHQAEQRALGMARIYAGGVQAIAIAAQALQAGSCAGAVAGGADSMPMVPMSGTKYSAGRLQM